MDEKDMGLLAEVYETVKTLAQKLFPILEKKKQSTSLQNVYEQVFYAGIEADMWMWLVDLFVNESTGAISAIFSLEGLIYQAPVTVAADHVTIGALTQVTTEFRPVGGSPDTSGQTPVSTEAGMMGYSKFVVHQATEKEPARWFLISSSTVLNRNAQMNARSLFDDLAAQDLTGAGEHPAVYLDFFHIGEATNMGTVDWVGRDENLLIASGLFNDGLMAECMQKAWTDDPDYWGSSISFWPLEGKMVEIADGISVPGYTHGYLDSITMLPEKDACCLMTALQVKGKVTMQKEIEDALKKLAGGDEALFSKLETQVNSANDKIVTEGLIHLSASLTAPAVPEVPAVIVEVPAPVVAEMPEFELSDEAVTRIVQMVTEHPTFTEAMGASAKTLQSVTDQFTVLNQAVAELKGLVQISTTSVEQRFSKLEKPLEDHVQQVINDMPRNAGATKVVLHRPSIESVKVEKKAAAEIAAETLANLK